MSKSFKPTFYTPREMEAIRAADRVVLRVLTGQGEWAVREFFPRKERGENLVHCLNSVEAAVDRYMPKNARACLYVAGMVRGELMMAAVKRTPQHEKSKTRQPTARGLLHSC
jgi:hypothetical protein